jgi:hypothetical protein
MSDRGGSQIPAAPQRVPGFPENFQPLIFEAFEGLNTKPLRPAIKDSECFWIDGWMPLGPDNARTLPGIGPTFYTAPTGLSIVWGTGANLADASYKVVLLSDGSMQQIASASGAVTQIMPPGTVQNPSSIMGFTQWGIPIPMFAFTKDQTNGYWLWDGTNLFTAGTISPEIDLTNSGLNYTSQPNFAVTTTGAGTAPTFFAQIENGSLAQITCTNPGSGFAVNDFVNLSITAGGSDDSANAYADISAPTVGGVDEVIVQQGGSGYTGATNIVATSVDGNGSGASFSFTASSGVITGIAILNPGTGYTAPPTIVASDPGYPGNHIPGGSGFVGVCIIAGGQITGITAVYEGTGY